MNWKYSISAILLALAFASGCSLKVNQINRRIDRWHSMQEDQADPQKMYDFATQSLMFFLNSGELQRTNEAVVSQQERLALHREMSSMQMYLLSWHASRALEAVEKPDPDWQLGRLEWSRADTVAKGRLPGRTTPFNMVFIQEGYNELVRNLILRPDEYNQMTRDFPGLMKALRQMSRFKYLEAEKLLAEGQRDKAVDNYLKVFTMDTENFPAADRLVRQFTGQGIKETAIWQFHHERAVQVFDNSRYDIFTTASGHLSQIAEEQGDEAADSMMYEVMSETSKTFAITPEQTMDVYYCVQTEQNGNLPEYLRLYRSQVLEGQRPIKPQIAQ